MSLAKRNPTRSCAVTVDLTRADYKTFLLSSFEELSQSQCAEFYRKIKVATIISASMPILDINHAYLKGVYAAETQGRLLTTRDDVMCEVRSWLTEHFGLQQRPRPIIGDLIKVTPDEVLNIIKYFWGGKPVSSDAIQDIALSLHLILQFTTAFCRRSCTVAGGLLLRDLTEWQSAKRITSQLFSMTGFSRGKYHKLMRPCVSY